MPHASSRRRTCILIACLFALAVLLLVVAVASRVGLPVSGKTAAEAVFAGTAGKIAFSSDRDGDWEIYVMNADGSGQTRLTNNLANDYVPLWSPNGSRIAFSSDRDGDQEIYVMNADGSGQTRLTNNSAQDGASGWSPDGSKIAFVSDRDGNKEIYVMNADGSGQARLTDFWGEDLEPVWSPDGGSIAFTRVIPLIAITIWVMNADGSGETLLSDDLQGGDANPAWSPDGSQIAYVHVDGHPTVQIYVMNADGTGQIRLTNNSANDGAPAWSPDGSKIAFVSDRDGNFEIYVMNADGSGQTRLTSNSANDQAPDWSPRPTPPLPAVLLVHGWQLPWQGANCESMDEVKTYLEANGYAGRVQCFEYDPDDGVKQAANELKRKVEQAPSKIHLVAHSFGGLVSRYYVEELGGASQVASLSMLGTPNRGVWAADLPTMLCLTMPPSLLKDIACGGAILEYLFDKAAWDMRPTSAILSSLNDGFSQPSTDYQVIAGTADGPLGWILYLNAPNDCVVSVWSAQGPGLPTATHDVIHTGLTGQLSWFCSDSTSLLDDSSVFADVLGVIQSASASGPLTVREPLGEASEASGEELANAGLIFDTVGPGETDEHTTWVEATSETGFALFWLAGDTIVPELRVTLETPGGGVIDASGPGVTYNPAAGPGFGGMMAESYVVETPEVGEWTLRVEAVDVPVEGLSYALVVSRDSPIAITPALDEGSYLVGQPILTTVAVTDDGAPVTDATVSALASTPSGDVPLSLRDDGLDGDTMAGDGVYSALVSDTSACGLYQFHLTATGTGGSFVREALLLTDVRVVGDAAGDPCLADDDGDGFHDDNELYLATDPLDACADNPSDDAWPPDITMDTVVDIFDALSFLAAFPSAEGEDNYSQRLDFSPDGVIDIFDAGTFLAFFPSACTNP